MPPLVALALAYVIGSIPSAYLAGRLARGIDLREHGSGNLGATNVFRVLGWKLGVAVLIIDAAKGAMPVAFFPEWSSDVRNQLAWSIAFGVAAIAGHVRPMFLLWKGGGKGVATAGGVFLALAPIPVLVASVAWLAALLLSGYVSLASLVASTVLPVALAIAYDPTDPRFIVSVPLSLFVFWAHRANIGRLRRGEEHRFGRKKAST